LGRVRRWHAALQCGTAGILGEFCQVCGCPTASMLTAKPVNKELPAIWTTTPKLLIGKN
jgi:hypothetical protein